MLHYFCNIFSKDLSIPEIHFDMMASNDTLFQIIIYAYSPINHLHGILYHSHKKLNISQIYFNLLLIIINISNYHH